MALFKLVDAHFCFLFTENVMLKDDVKKKEYKNNKQNSNWTKKKEKNALSAHFFQQYY